MCGCILRQVSLAIREGVRIIEKKAAKIIFCLGIKGKEAGFSSAKPP